MGEWKIPVSMEEEKELEELAKKVMPPHLTQLMFSISAIPTALLSLLSLFRSVSSNSSSSPPEIDIEEVMDIIVRWVSIVMSSGIERSGIGIKGMEVWMEICSFL